MKSPLVDAIRQASGDSSKAKRTESLADSQAVDTNQESEVEKPIPDVGDLSLMDSTSVLPVDDAGILPIDGAGILPIDGAGILPIDGAGIPDHDDDDDVDAVPGKDVDAQFYETIKMEIANDDDAAGTHRMAVAAASVSPQLLSSLSRRSRIPRIGFYSPLISLFLAATSAGAYFAFNGLGGLTQNSDLASLSYQIDSPGAAAGESENTVETKNRFELIIGAPPAGVNRRRNDDSTDVARVAAAPVTSMSTVKSRSQFSDAAFEELQRAYAAYELGDFDTAESGYRSALSIAPRHPGALHGLAAILHKTGRLDESLSYYETLLSVEPNNTAAAVALLSGAEASTAIANESEIKQLIQQHPESAHLQFALGLHFAKRGRWADARHRFDQALRLAPENADYLFNLAVSLENLGQYDDARYYYESALSAARANSTLDSDAVVARIGKLALLSGAEKQTP